MAKTKNPAAVALGRRTSVKKRASSRANAQRPRWTRPQGVSVTLWAHVVEQARRDGLDRAELYTQLFTAYLGREKAR